jgi:hypothetical protein
MNVSSVTPALRAHLLLDFSHRLAESCPDSPARAGRAPPVQLLGSLQSGEILVPVVWVRPSRLGLPLCETESPPARGRPWHRPARLHAAKGYDYPRCHAVLRARWIRDRIARQARGRHGPRRNPSCVTTRSMDRALTAIWREFDRPVDGEKYRLTGRVMDVIREIATGGYGRVDEVSHKWAALRPH